MAEVTMKKIPYRVTPYYLEIRSLHKDSLKLKDPLSVLVEEEEDQVIAYAPNLEIYGCGDDMVEALEDLRQSIVEFYLDLKEHLGKLGKDLQRVWQYLSSTVVEV